MRVRIWGSLLVAVWCAGCSAAQPTLPLVNAVAPGQARITVTREALPGPPVIIDDINGGHVAEMQAALIDVNDAHVADLQPGQTYVGGVPPGPTSVTATGTAEPGHYVVKFNAVAGKPYAFQLAPRTDATRRLAMGTGLVGYASRPPQKVKQGPLQDHSSRAVSAAMQLRCASAEKTRPPTAPTAAASDATYQM